MKKFVHILAALAVCTCMLLTACGNSESNTGNNNNNSSNIGNNANANNNEDNNNDNNDNDNNNSNDSNDSSNDNSSGSEKVEYSHGTFDENGKYINKFIGIGADFNTDEWIAFDDDYLSAYNGGVSSEDDLKSRLESNNMVYEMMVGKETGSNINVVIQKIGNSVSEEEYIDYNLEVIEDQLVSTGTMEDPHASKNSVSFAGASRFALDVEGSSDGLELYERIIAIKRGEYICMITITAQSDGERDEFTSMFYGA